MPCCGAPGAARFRAAQGGLSQPGLGNTFYLREARCPAGRYEPGVLIWPREPEAQLLHEPREMSPGYSPGSGHNFSESHGWVEAGNLQRAESGEPRSRVGQPLPFPEGNGEDQRRAITCPRSHSRSAAEPDLPRAPGPWSWLSPALGRVGQLLTSPRVGTTQGVRNICIWHTWGLSLGLDPQLLVPYSLP